MQLEALYQCFLNSNGITTDTRNLLSGGMFFALKGANFNGNKFANQALIEGCAYAVVDEKQDSFDERIILVDDVLLTLQHLANYHRKQFNIPVIGITGSNGKTTSKELITAVLSEKFNTLSTIGNLNNHLGVPFTLLRLNASHEIAIIEMGANKPGDIKELVEIAEPTHGIITNIGAAHIEGFGSIEGVVKTKGEMYDFVQKQGGTLFYHTADETLNRILPKNLPVFSFGEFEGDIQGMITQQAPFVNFRWSMKDYQSPELRTNLVGRYNFTNFLLAIAVGTYFGVEPERINQAISNYVPSNNRSQITKTERNTLIVDCYNANATSMKAALESFVEMNAERKLVILGDMRELGDISKAEHQKIIDFITANQLDAILVGDEMSNVAGNIMHFQTSKALNDSNKLASFENTLILLKGSRGIRLEEVIPSL